MRSPIHALAWLALLVLTNPVLPVSQSSVPAPGGVVLRFHNGSVVQPAVLLDAVELETRFGKVTVPVGEVRRVEFGFRLTAAEARELGRALRDLGSNQFRARQEATQALTRMGRLAYPTLVQRRKSGDPEVSKRVETILNAIRLRVPPYRLQTRPTDIVRTSDSTLTGRITAASLRFRCDLFGEFKAPTSQLRDLRSLLLGAEQTVTVDAARYGNMSSWKETDFEVTTGTRLEVRAEGEINLDPANRLNNNATRGVRPDGTPQLNSGEGNLPGHLLGRIGPDGPVFVIGSRYTGFPDREGKLYLRIVTIEHANGVKAEGAYRVQVSAEPN